MHVCAQLCAMGLLEASYQSIKKLLGQLTNSLKSVTRNNFTVLGTSRANRQEHISRNMHRPAAVESLMNNLVNDINQKPHFIIVCHELAGEVLLGWVQ